MFNIIAYSPTPESKHLEEFLVQYLIPIRALPMATSDSLLILPDNARVREFKSFYENHVHEGRELPCLWARDSDFCMDIDIASDSQLLAQLRDRIAQRIRRGIAVRIKPYSYNSYSQTWIDPLIVPGVTVDGEDLEFARRFKLKSVLHRKYNGQKIHRVRSSVIRVPRGYFCSTKKELQSAHSCLLEQGITQFFLKAIDLSAGEGITEISSSVDNVNIRKSGVIIEEKLALDTNKLGLVSNCSIEFSEKKTIGLPSTQLLKGYRWDGNLYPAIENELFIEDASKQAELVLRFLTRQGMKGPGGLDFVSSDNKAYLIDNNLARVTGTHGPKEFHRKYAPDSHFALQNFENCSKSIQQIWNGLVRHGLQLNNGKGIFPLLYLRNSFSTFISFEKDTIEALDKLKQMELLVL